MTLSLLWLRRDLRLHDHAALAAALAIPASVQPVFLFDSDILARFRARDDRRLSFIAHTLSAIHASLTAKGGGLLVLHGKPEDVIPKLARALSAGNVFAAEDYEPATRMRDASVAQALQGSAKTHFVKDQLIFSPSETLRSGNEPYKVYTPYSRIWHEKLTPASAAPFTIADAGRYADCAQNSRLAKASGLKVIDAGNGPGTMLEAIGYEYKEDALWQAVKPQARLKRFIREKSAHYATARNMLAEDGTSRISPYLRFGLLSIRECVAAAIEAGGAGANNWLSELIWREFYAMILYHFPESAATEWNPRYRGRLHWSDNGAHFTAWQEGKTGYPLVDAAMRQLLAEGWMHNRARMVVASFLTKHLRIDWRRGEEHFAQYLMDYDMASNVGGWQWAASVGTDAQPYFRVFNPTLQSEKFDPGGDYIRRYVPELAKVPASHIHAPWENALLAPYYPPIVEHANARAAAIAMFKE